MKNFSVILTIKGEKNDFFDLIERINSQKNIDSSDYEVIVIDASIKKLEVQNIFNEKISFKYLSYPNITRTSALNMAIKNSIYEVIIRLDVRSIFNEYYFYDLMSLYNKVNCSNVGFVQQQIATSENNKFQKNLTLAMNNKFINGFAKYKYANYEGNVDTIYLGCYNKADIIKVGLFDELNPNISEDADLNYRLIKNRKKIYLSSKSKVFYKARENFISHIKKIFEYGISKSIFFKKYFSFSNIRQSTVLFFFTTIAFLLILSLFSSFFIFIFLLFVIIYLFFYLCLAFSIASFKYSSLLIFFLSVSFHIVWYCGFIFGILFKKLNK